MAAAMPNLEKLTGDYEVSGHIKIRPADLYVTGGCDRPGIVLVGDAFATSCPAAGTGTGKVFTDVERLCNVHVPQWFATSGMGADKIAAFYADPEKRANDALSREKAYALRSLSIDESMAWELRRQVRFATRWSVGKLRAAQARLKNEPASPKSPASGLLAG
jgi:2-polyprenyl-6-methoxyphenol hydroxylase-like FAD-dependent oxidoreductase